MQSISVLLFVLLIIGCLGIDSQIEGNVTCPSSYYPKDGKCALCTDGHYCLGYKYDQIPCPSGKYAYYTSIFEDRSDCKSCPSGLFQSKEGQSFCHYCPNGHYCPNTLEPLKCIKGTFSRFLKNSNRTLCNQCPIRTYQDKEGQMKCITCPPNHFCKTTGLINPMPCNKFSSNGDDAQAINVCQIEDINQYDYHKWITTIDELQNSIIEEVWEFHRILNQSHIRVGPYSHSGLLVRVVGAPANQYYMIQLLSTLHPDGLFYGDIYVDRIDNLELKKKFLSTRWYYEWFGLKFYIKKYGKSPVGEWSLLDAYLRMYRASFRKDSGVYSEIFNNCHQAERTVRKAMGIYKGLIGFGLEFCDEQLN